MFETYGVFVLLFFLVLLVEWWPYRLSISFGIVVFGAVFWPLSLCLWIHHHWNQRKQKQDKNLYV